MKRIGLLSDTHGSLPEKATDFFASCDEIWHAGDIGNLETAKTLSGIKPLRAVYGNIDGGDVRSFYPEYQLFDCESVKVLILHIGGYPGRYSSRAVNLIKTHRPALFISGHSHILKVIYDNKNQLLHMNPGAAGKQGFHQVITLLRFSIEGKDIKELEILELKRH
ncbi:MAG: metallophosphoesterase family protein [Lentimicrobium sp.]|jgi:putative phosphoesterase|nr:metallophosphoesterase family protein [Lentimicrobium sp.]